MPALSAVSRTTRLADGEPTASVRRLVEHAEWNADVRGESEIQRVDRNFLELLQELRVAQTGVQILFAFLLGLAFAPRFRELDPTQRGVYVATLVVSATAAALLIAPVMYHRLVFRRRLKAHLVAVTHRYAVVGLTLLLLALVGSVHLAASLVIGDWSALLAAVLATVFVGVWFGVPLLDRVRHGSAATARPEPGRSRSNTP